MSSRLELWVGALWGIVPAGIEVEALLPEIWASSIADFSQDLSAPILMLNCSV